MENKLSRKHQARRRLVNNLLLSLLSHQKIKTTGAKAKALKIVAQKVLAQIKLNDLKSQKALISRFGKNAVELGNKYKDGSYKVSSFKVSKRFGDNALITLVRIEKSSNEVKK